MDAERLAETVVGDVVDMLGAKGVERTGPQLAMVKLSAPAVAGQVGMGLEQCPLDDVDGAPGVAVVVEIDAPPRRPPEQPRLVRRIDMEGDVPSLPRVAADLGPPQVGRLGQPPGCSAQPGGRFVWRRPTPGSIG